MDTTRPTTIVLGAGVVGLSTALYLQRSGHNVTVVDPLPPAGGASYGNSGLISSDTAVPIALPGMLGKVPKWLADPMGPLVVRPSYFPRAAVAAAMDRGQPDGARAEDLGRDARCTRSPSNAGARCSGRNSSPT
ncbi:MAG: FAD-dependent oxidoreductase [Betaproteobacteria bacterium]|nr:FAD-dependent oxidoreductase [Betaproteobacteria bacterium]